MKKLAMTLGACAKSLAVKQNMGHGCLYGPDVDVFHLETLASSPATPLAQP
jgi:hypothetical protein